VGRVEFYDIEARLYCPSSGIPESFTNTMQA
jgi:hypothetical protein